MRKRIIILYGPPGSGKGTQSYLLSKKHGFVQFDIGSYLESVVHDKRNRRNAAIQKQRKLFDSGELCDSAWVARVVGEQLTRFAHADLSVVLSGSFRTLRETFGEDGKGLLSTVVQLYGKKNIQFFYIDIPISISIKRNSGRKVCSLCDHPVMHVALKREPNRCPVCGGALRIRTLDKQEIIRKRNIIFHQELSPVLQELRRQKFLIHKIDGRSAPYKVFQNLEKWL